MTISSPEKSGKIKKAPYFRVFGKYLQFIPTVLCTFFDGIFKELYGLVIIVKRGLWYMVILFIVMKKSEKSLTLAYICAIIVNKYN